MNLRSHGHVNEDESKGLDYSKRRNAPRTNEKKDNNRHHDNPDT